jgi:hypothetical protein
VNVGLLANARIGEKKCSITRVATRVTLSPFPLKLCAVNVALEEFLPVILVSSDDTEYKDCKMFFIV